MKKAIVFVLAVMLVMSMAVPTFAATASPKAPASSSTTTASTPEVVVTGDVKVELVAVEDAKKEYQEALRECRMHRNEAGFLRDKAKVEETNLWTLNNNTIQSDRHNIFERYRDAGGVLTGAEEGLLHPGWTKDKKGGVSDEKE